MTAPTTQLPEPSRPGGRHILALDGLRGTAILLVVLLHATEAFGRVHPVPTGVAAVLNVGFTGVDLFFVLSGFLISGILLASKGGPSYFRVFYIRRTLRIFPLYYAYLCADLRSSAVDIGTDPRQLRRIARAPAVVLDIPRQLPQCHAGWLAHGRSADESLLVSCGRRAVLSHLARCRAPPVRQKSLTAICAFAIIVVTPFLRLGLRIADVNPVAVYVLTFCRADALAFGALIAVTLRADGEKPSSYPSIRCDRIRHHNDRSHDDRGVAPWIWSVRHCGRYDWLQCMGSLLRRLAKHCRDTSAASGVGGNGPFRTMASILWQVQLCDVRLSPPAVRAGRGPLGFWRRRRASFDDRRRWVRRRSPDCIDSYGAVQLVVA